MPRFTYTSLIDAPVDRVFAFHESPDALERLTPPWQPARVLHKDAGLKPGSRVVLEVPLGPFTKKWIALHVKYEKNRLFVDEQIEGPFRRWVHHHRFETVGKQTRLIDDIDFSLPGGPLVDFFGAWVARLQLRRLFRYRHAATQLSLSKRIDTH